METTPFGGHPLQRGDPPGRSAGLSACRRVRLRDQRGLTLVEVAFASVVLALAITTSITVLQQGFRAIDTARSTTIAGQVLQSMIEDVRLLMWSQTETFGTSKEGKIEDFYAGGWEEAGSSFTDYNATAAATLARFTFTRTVQDTPDAQANMKIIVLTARWKGIDGREHSLSYSTYYARYGLYDYYNT